MTRRGNFARKAGLVRRPREDARRAEKLDARLMLCRLHGKGRITTLSRAEVARWPLLRRLKIRHNIGVVEDDPDLILCWWGMNSTQIYRDCLRLRRRFGYEPALGVVSHENLNLDAFAPADFSMSKRPFSANNFYVPFGLLGPPDRYRNLRAREGAAPAARPVPQRFCNFVYSHQGVAAREDFCRRLSRYKRVDCPSFVLNNMQEPGFGALRREVPARAAHEHLLNFMANYKFTIAFENEAADWYVTEKIWNALEAGSVPIYWGAPQIAELLNPDCFVNCNDYPDFDAVVERVKQIDQDPALYERYRRAPVFLPSSKGHSSDMVAAAVFLGRMASDALDARSPATSRARCKRLIAAALRCEAARMKGRVRRAARRAGGR